MKSIKEVIEDDSLGFIFWCIFLVVFLLEMFNLDFVMKSIIDAYTYGLAIDFILSLIIAICLPLAFVSLCYNVWVK